MFNVFPVRSLSYVFYVLHVYHVLFLNTLEYVIMCSVYHLFLCEVCYFDMCEYIEYMKYVGSMIELLNDLYLNHQIQHCTQQMTRSSNTKE